jgi:translation initiation factor 1 (eIF-1/SUI1)
MTTITFNNQINDFEKELYEEIHIHMMATKGKKCITMLDGFVLEKEDEKKFMKMCQKKFSTNGYKKLILEINQKTEVICFSGDVRYALKELLQQEYEKSDSIIRVHG